MSRTSSYRRHRALIVATAAGLLCAGMAAAQDASELEQRRTQVLQQMEEIKHQSQLSAERLAELKAETASIDRDKTAITAELVQAAKTEKKLSQDIEDIEDRLVDLTARADTVRQSLSARRGTLAEVLGALERMGRNPPPALVVRPEDALSSVRTAIMLGAVIPEMRTETERLLADLTELSRIAATAEAEKAKLATTMTGQAEELARLSALLDRKQALQAELETESAGLQAKSEELAKQSKDVGALIGSIEQEIEAVRQAALDAERAEEKRLRESRERAEQLTPKENRLAAALPFTALKGKLQPPAVGHFVHRFGDDDPTGHAFAGDTLATQSGAIVTAPADGKVLFAGAFRSYGQLLILDAGEAYHLVMAGMDRLNVAQGQSVLSGEPVGIMGESRIASAAFDGNTSAQPVLYIEFRRNKTPVDPGPWWSRSSLGRTENDS